MTKDQKRILALEQEVKNLREQLLQLAMRPTFVYVQPAQQTVTTPNLPYSPYVITTPNSIGGGSTSWSGVRVTNTSASN